MRERKDCRLCGGNLKQVFSFLPTPIANSFPDEPDADAERYPLELMQCHECGHVQQRYVFDGLFKDYKYSTPEVVKEYLEPQARRIAQKFPGERVLEIGCNNGIFIDLLVEHGLDAYGIDPAATHVRALPTYFGYEVAQYLGRFKCIVGNNVFAHIDNLEDVFRGVQRCLEPDGEFVFEVQYLVDLLDSGRFDMCYHEHMDYHHLKPLQGFLKRFGMVMTGYENIPQHGGSIRVFAAKVGEECEIPHERLDWQGFGQKIEAEKKRLHEKIVGKVVAFGAPAKATTLVSEFGLRDKISYVVDDTPQKQGKYIPGTDIPIKPTSEVGDGPVLLLCWNFEKEVRRKIPNPLIVPYG